MALIAEVAEVRIVGEVLEVNQLQLTILHLEVFQVTVKIVAVLQKYMEVQQGALHSTVTEKLFLMNHDTKIQQIQLEEIALE